MIEHGLSCGPNCEYENCDCQKATQIDDGGPAFPHESPKEIFAGMTLRDWFAGMALNGLLSAGHFVTDATIEEAFSAADCMIFRRVTK